MSSPDSWKPTSNETVGHVDCPFCFSKSEVKLNRKQRLYFNCPHCGPCNMHGQSFQDGLSAMMEDLPKPEAQKQAKPKKKKAAKTPTGTPAKSPTEKPPSSEAENKGSSDDSGFLSFLQ